MTVLVLGSINMDLVVDTPRLPVPGETLRGTKFRTSPGGKGANQAVAAARQGASARLIGRIGGDEFGDQLVGAIRAAGVGVSTINVDRDAATGLALICVAATGENTIVTVRGANGNIGREELDMLARLLPRAIVLMIQLEVPLEIVTAAATAARDAGVIVILDPAPVTELPDVLLGNVSWITPNETEAEALTGIAPFDERASERAARSLRERGVGRVTITRGARGCFYSGPDGTFAIPAPPVEAVDTVGAGDAFNGALAAGILAGREPAQILRRACSAGAIACTRRGAQPSLPTASELDAMFED